MTTRKIKNEIIKLWSDNFEFLTAYSQNKLFRVCGPLVLGIEMFHNPELRYYRPIFVCYPLWKLGITECMEEPVILQEIYNQKGLQFNISYLKSDTSFFEALEAVRNQASILYDPEISIEQLFDLIDLQFLQLTDETNALAFVKLLETKFFIALYNNDLTLCNSVLRKLKKHTRNYESNLLETKNGKLDVWFKNLRLFMSDRNKFLKLLKINKQQKKIAKLLCTELLQ